MGLRTTYPPEPLTYRNFANFIDELIANYPIDASNNVTLVGFSQGSI